jgi:hypothetical protein
MVHIYRLTRYADRDFLIFQASPEIEERLRNTFSLTVKPTKKGFEPGYFCWLRNEYRGYFNLIKRFFSQNYSPPEVRLSVFRSNGSLSDRWPPQFWQQKVTSSIKSAFSGNGYKIREDRLSGWVEVIPDKPVFSKGNLEIYWGAAFRVQVPEDRFPLLFCEERFWFFREGKPVGLAELAQEHGEGSDLLKSVRSLTTRNTEEHFDLLCRFVKRIPPLADCERISFNPEPVRPEDIGFETWFWLHEFETSLETGNGLRTILGQALLGSGLYFQPDGAAGASKPRQVREELLKGSGLYFQPDDIQVVLLVPLSGTSPAIPNINWQQIGQVAEMFLSKALPNVNVPFCMLEYPLDDHPADFLEKLEAIKQSQPNRRFLVLMITPGSEDRYSDDPEKQSAESRSYQLGTRVREMCKGGYVATVDWNRLINPKDLKYIVQNAIFGGLYRLHAQPWKLVDLPFGDSPSEATYFLGLASDPKAFALAGVLIDCHGVLMAYGARVADKSKNPQAFDITAETDQIIRTLLKYGVSDDCPPPNRLIVHIGPDMEEYVDHIQKATESRSIASDIVLIVPDSGVRLWQPGNKQGTPSHGIAIGSESQKIAYLMNTLAVAEKTTRETNPTRKTNQVYIYPCPTSVMVRQLYGTTSLKVLAAHVYWLSVAHINALHRTVDMPVTIAYARSLCDYTARTGRPLKVTQTREKKVLYWL